jgi:hypothetical protein
MDVLALAGGVLAIVGIAGGSAGYFKSKRGDAIIAYQAREIELRDGTITRLEKDNLALSTKCDSQTEQIATLKELAQGSPQLKLLTAAQEKTNRLLQALLKDRENGKVKS